MVDQFEKHYLNKTKREEISAVMPIFDSKNFSDLIANTKTLTGPDI